MSTHVVQRMQARFDPHMDEKRDAPPTTLRIQLPDGRQHVMRLGWIPDADTEVRESYEAAFDAAAQIGPTHKELKESGLYTEAGLEHELATHGVKFAATKAKALLKLEKGKLKVAADINKMISLDPPAADDVAQALQHERLLNVWLGTPDKAQLMHRLNSGQHPELALALVREPTLVTSISDEFQDDLHRSLLTEDERGKVDDLTLEFEYLEKTERAWGQAADVLTYFCGAESLVATTEEVDDPNKRPNVQPNEYLALANGATFEIGAAS